MLRSITEKYKRENRAALVHVAREVELLRAFDVSWPSTYLWYVGVVHKVALLSWRLASSVDTI